MKILIAEDESNTLQIVRLALEARGHQVITTTDGEECVNVYRNEFFACARQSQLSIHSGVRSNQPFDFVILDIRMPKKSGTQAAEEIVALNPNQRIFFATAYSSIVLQDLKLQDKYKFEWLQKPFEIDLLADMLEEPPLR